MSILPLKVSGNQQHWRRGQAGAGWWSSVCQQRPGCWYYSGYGYTDRCTGGWLSLNQPLQVPRSTHSVLWGRCCFIAEVSLFLLLRESPQESTTQLWWQTVSSGKLQLCVRAAAAGISLTLWSTAPSCTSASSPLLWLTWRTLWQ